MGITLIDKIVPKNDAFHGMVDSVEVLCTQGSILIGRTTAGAGVTAELTAANVKTLLSLTNVEDTALTTWAGSTAITTLGTIGTGTWNATAIADGKIASALTGKTYNGLTITANGTNTLNIAAGKTLTVSNSLTFTATDGSTLAIGTGGTLGTAAYTATTAYEAAGAIATHAALQTGVHGISITSGKTLTASNTLTLTGTDSASVAFGAGGTVTYTTNKLSVFAATTSAELAGVISDETGSGALVFAASPTLASPAIRTAGEGVFTAFRTDGGNAGFEIGSTAAGTNLVYFDILTNDVDFHVRISRAGGTNGDFTILNTGTGGFYLGNNGANKVYLDSTGNLNPVLNDGVALGTTSTSWADLFLASGAVINWASGDATITHATNSLAVTGANYSFTGAGVSGGATTFSVLPENHSTVIAGTISFLTETNTLTVTASYSTQIFSVFNGSSINAASGWTVTTAETLAVNNAPTSLGSVIIKNPVAFRVTGSCTIVPQADTTTSAINIRAETITLTGTTQVTSACGVAQLRVNAPVVSQTGGAVTVDSAASVYIAGAPTANASVTITNKYALWVDAGTSAFGGNLVPDTTDGAALGTTDLMFSDLFLAAGAVINFNSDVTVTHTTNALTFEGGNVGIGIAPNNYLEVGTGSLGTLAGIAICLSNSAANSTFGFGQSSTARARMAWVYNATEASAYMMLGDATGSAHFLVLQDQGGNVKIGGTAVRGTTEGTKHLDIFDGTAPIGTLTNGVSIYSTAGECYIMDAAGNATLQSPHDENNYWVFDSTNTVTKKRLKIDMEKMMRFLNAKFGTDFVHDFIV